MIAIRARLSPHTQIAIDELGTDVGVEGGEGSATATAPYGGYSPLYWVATGGNWTANFVTAERLGLPMLSMTQMLGYPLRSEVVSMTNWETCRPNAHYWTLKLVAENFGPGEELVRTRSSSSDIIAQAAVTGRGRKVLLVNTSNHRVRIGLPGGISPARTTVTAVDPVSGERRPRRLSVGNRSFVLLPFATAVIVAGTSRAAS